jgi:hypothetical protein
MENAMTDMDITACTSKLLISRRLGVGMTVGCATAGTWGTCGTWSRLRHLDTLPAEHTNVNITLH